LHTGFQRIRHYGLFANRDRQANLERLDTRLANPNRSCRYLKHLRRLSSAWPASTFINALIAIKAGYNIRLRCHLNVLISCPPDRLDEHRILLCHFSAGRTVSGPALRSLLRQPFAVDVETPFCHSL
jgi:hypothetical protein